LSAEVARFTLEAPQSIGIGGKRGGQHLDRHVALQPGVARAIHLAHSAGTDQMQDLVRTETIAGG
jgi:hypothetical protein